MRATVFYVVAAIALAGAFGGGCSYDPHPIDGRLRCSSSGECPEGYSCTTCGTCWSDLREGDNSGGLWGSGASSSTLSRYVGSWAFSSCANLETQCDDLTDSSPINDSPDNPSIMYLTAGASGTADIVSDWLCILNLRLSSEGAALYGSGQECTIPNSSVPGLIQTWRATRFEIVTRDGINAVHSAAYTRLDEYDDGSVSTCTQQVHAPMTKQ